MRKSGWLLVSVVLILGAAILLIPTLIIGGGASNTRATQTALAYELTQEVCIAPLPVLNPDRIARGAVIYARECADCHGANLEGDPNWETKLGDGSNPPPPLDGSGHATHHSDAGLLTLLNYGVNYGKESYMPGYKGILNDDEQMAVLEYVKSFWGQDFFSHQHSLAVSVRLGWVEPAKVGEEAHLHLILDNPARFDTRLIQASSEVADQVDLVNSTGQIFSEISLPAKTLDIVLDQGGEYLTLKGLKQPLEEGDTFWLRLRFTGVGEVLAEIKVRSN